MEGSRFAVRDRLLPEGLPQAGGKTLLVGGAESCLFRPINEIVKCRTQLVF